MERIEFHVVKKFLELEGNFLNKIADRLRAVYGSSFPSESTIRSWFGVFKCRRIRPYDYPIPGDHRNSAVERPIKENQQISLYEIEEEIDLWRESIETLTALYFL